MEIVLAQYVVLSDTKFKNNIRANFEFISTNT